MNKSVLYSWILFIFIGLVSFLAVYSTTVDNAGIFEFVDSTPVIFIVFGLILFLALWTLDGLISLIGRLLHLSSRSFFNLLFALIAIAVFGGLKVKGWNPASDYAGYIKVSLVILPVFFLFQYLNAKYLKNKSFQDAELVKFIFLFFSSILLLFMSSEIAFLVDSALLEDIVRKPNRWEPKIIFFGFIFAFTLGNLLNNIRKYIWSLRLSEKKLQKSEEQVLESQAALDALHASINPHFLYNALNSIAGLAKTDPVKTEKMAISLSAFYRYVTNKDQKHLSTVDEELRMIDNYLQIEKIRFGDSLNVELKVADEARTCAVPHFILQPIVENAIKYGFDGKGVSVVIEISIGEDQLILRVFDNGKAFDESLATGYGLKSVAEKLRLLFPDKHQLSFVNAPEKHVFISIEQSN
jgi:sensor histidine kinase YesM